ncbi:MAG: MobF family relaxase [Sporichthyaceae bacterium]
MSLARLSAGSGYRYLLRHTAGADGPRPVGQSLSDYYAASGNPPGRWFGSGLAGLAGGDGLAIASTVTEEAMAALYGAGQDPVSGEPLGRAFPVFTPAAKRIADAVAGLPASLTESQRQAAVVAIESHVAAKPGRRAVAGFDLTFTAPKSASVLWALGDEHVQAAVEAAHRQAIDTVLALIEERFLFTRTGTHSLVQVRTRGAIAAAFDHYDTRAGDPNLHTHVVLANKVQGPDGAWRAVDAQVLFRTAVACSEVYDVALADALSARLPVTWSYRDRGPRRNPAFEIDGVDENLLQTFSTRAGQITARVAEMLAEFTEAHGHAPSRTQTIQLRQQATLETRPVKQASTLTGLRARWQEKAAARVGGDGLPDPDRRLPRVRFTQRLSHGQIPVGYEGLLADHAVAAVGARRATWTRTNLLAEAARATKHLRMRTPADRVALLDRVVQASLERCVPLDFPLQNAAPQRFSAAHAVSASNEEAAFTTRDILDAEARLLAAAAEDCAPAAQPAAVAALLDTPMMPGTGRALAVDQRRAVEDLAGSGRRIDVLVGPAGTGKTRTVRALAAVWRQDFGPGTVVGLAPSATAATELTAAVGVRCQTIAKWSHTQGGATARGQEPPTLPQGCLVVVDEAAMATTADLDAIVSAARLANAKVVLVGDDRQLGAVGAGGVFALLAEGDRAVQLETLWRFHHPWEAQVTRTLRNGNAQALAEYENHGRLHAGEAATMLEDAYAGWARDVAAGHDSLLLAADRATVAALNDRVQADRRAVGAVAAGGVAAAEGVVVGHGDVVVTRRNERRLELPGGDHVRNGARWVVAEARPDGSLDLQPIPDPSTPAPDSYTLHVPAEYVRDHVELGYAATVHRAQGATVDTCHVVAGAAMTRQTLYVALTRGREANHVYVPTDSADWGDGESTGRQRLETILARDGGQHSATAQIRARLRASLDRAASATPSAAPSTRNSAMVPRGPDVFRR